MRISSRVVARLAAVTVPLVLALVVAGSASADAPTTWEKGGEGLSTLQALLIFIGIPLGLFVVIGLFASISGGKNPSRPAAGVEKQPEWFGAPDESESKALTDGSEPPRPGGGASATW